eukprot:scaffold5141_cov169-Amphora_coffeaeformis.AAC.6
MSGTKDTTTLEEATATTSLLSRHYKPTLGIDDVFLEPPSHSLPSVYVQKEQNAPAAFLSTEMVGRLKTTPEDFIVREIMDFQNGISVLGGDDEQDTVHIATFNDNPLKPPPPLDEAKSTTSTATAKSDDHKVTADDTNIKGEIDWSTAECQPLEILSGILKENATLDILESPDQLVKDLSALQARIIQNLNPPSTTENDKDKESSHKISGRAAKITLQGDNSREERGLVHRWVRSSFPMLHTEVAPPTTEDAAAEAKKDIIVISVQADDRFYGLLPFLHDPKSDLPRLYSFFRQGNDDEAPSNNGCRGRQCSDQLKVVLPLQVDLERSQRRYVHQLLVEKSGRHFYTDTLSEYVVEGSNVKTAAIVVTWSQKANRKRKRHHHDADGKKVPTPSYCTLLVLRKRNVEHTYAIHSLSQSLRCRPGDIQFAGIKDKQAITTQFITLNKFVPVKRIISAQGGLRSQGLDLCGPLRFVKDGLRRGQAQGNRFAIVLRDLRQVRVALDGLGNTHEEMIVAEQHAMKEAVERLKRCGFINFYGEQRIGSVAVEGDTRTVDWGRSLLRREWNQLLDMIMRSGIDGNSTRVSQVWQSSRGDEIETWKALAKSQGGESRQRRILQSLKRHGTDDPLAILEGFSHSDRSFWISSYQSFVWNKAASERIRRYGAKDVVVGDLVESASGSLDKKPTLVTSEEMARGYSIESVVLPLPGYNVEYPSNLIGQVYQDLLTTDGVEFTKDAPIGATAKGSYRSLIARAQNVQHHWLNEDSAPACRFQFDLPSGSYATMLLRELLRTTVAR